MVLFLDCEVRTFQDLWVGASFYRYKAFPLCASCAEWKDKCGISIDDVSASILMENDEVCTQT